jgi:PEP-CTERM motif
MFNCVSRKSRQPGENYMNPIRIFVTILLGLTAFVARADISTQLNLLGGTPDSWSYNSPLTGGTTTTLNFERISNDQRQYTVLIYLNVTDLAESDRPDLSSVTLDGAAMSFHSHAVGLTSTYGEYAFLGLLSGGPHALTFNFNSNLFSSVGARVSIAPEPMQAPAPVPEPETWAMLLAGLGLLSHNARNRRKLNQV